MARPQSRIGVALNSRTVRGCIGQYRIQPNSYRNQHSKQRRTGALKASGETKYKTKKERHDSNIPEKEQLERGRTATFLTEIERIIAKSLKNHESSVETPPRQTVEVKTVIRSAFRTVVSFILVLLAVLLLFAARMSFEYRTGSPQKRRRDEQESSIAEDLEQHFNSFNTRGLLTPATPARPPRIRTEAMTNQASELSEQQSNGATTPNSEQEVTLAKVLQMMAESLSQVRSQTPPIYAPQLRPYPADSVPTFDRNNATAFLERYEDMTKYHSFTDIMKINRLTAHCKSKQRAIIQASKDYLEAPITESCKSFRDAL
jgi:hypothetical protein